MSDFEAAAFLGIGLGTYRSIKYGYRLSLPMICTKRLKEAGYPGDPAADYRKWREELVREAKEKVRLAFESWREFQRRRELERRASEEEST